MHGESIVSIELAVGAAVFVLGARLFALIQATRGVPAAHAQMMEALSAGDPRKLHKKARGLGYRNPYGEVAAQLIEASQREAVTPSERIAILERAAGVATRRIRRRTQQGQAMDLVAFSVALGIVAFARDGLPAGPLFWSLAGAVMVLLLSSLIARATLQASVLGSFESLRSVLVTRPQLPSLSDGPLDCFWCGEKTEERSFSIRDTETGTEEQVMAAVCGECGKLVTTLPIEDEAESTESGTLPTNS